MNSALIIFGVLVLFAGLGRLAWPKARRQPAEKRLHVTVNEEMQDVRSRFETTLDKLSEAEQRSRALADDAEKARLELEALRAATEKDAATETDAQTARAR